MKCMHKKAVILGVTLTVVSRDIYWCPECGASKLEGIGAARWKKPKPAKQKAVKKESEDEIFLTKIKNLVQESKFIESIKQVRQMTGGSLLDCKKFCDGIKYPVDGVMLSDETLLVNLRSIH